MKKILSRYSVWLREVGIFSIFGSMTSHIVTQVQSMNIKTDMKEEPIDNILTLFHHFQQHKYYLKMDTDEVDIITDLMRVTEIDVNACQHLLVAVVKFL